MLKYQLSKTSGLQFDNWLVGPEKFTGLSSVARISLSSKKFISGAFAQAQVFFFFFFFFFCSTRSNR